MTLVKFRVPAVANQGGWVVRCFRCTNAEDAAIDVFFCRRCGATAEIEWPPPAMVAGVERLLLMRPDVMNQSWEPGETLIDLMVENAVHGLFDDLPEGMTELVVEPERIRIDMLPPTFRTVFCREELKAIA